MLEITVCFWVGSLWAGTLPLATGDLWKFRAPENVSLTPDGSFLAWTRDRVLHWSPQGNPILQIQAGEADVAPPILDAFYHRGLGLYWLIAGQHLDSVFFDTQGQRLEARVEGALPDEARVYFRKIIAVGERLFAVDIAALDLWRDQSPPVLREIGIAWDGAGAVAIHSETQAFARVTQAQRRMEYNFKIHWIASDPYHGNLFVMDQLSPQIRHFVPRFDGGYEEQPNPIPVALPRYRPPPQTMSDTVKTEEESRLWWASWSRITGFYALGQEYLVGYEVPNPDRPGETLLALQKITRHGKNMGKLRLERGSLMGVDEDWVYLFQTNTAKSSSRYAVNKITW